MTSTIYIDANRTNSQVKSIDTNNEWTYKMSNTLQIPAGSEIGVENAFIHKQGISGATIEIDEDVIETINFHVYLTDNPHFNPKSMTDYDTRTRASITKNRTTRPSFQPFGYLMNTPMTMADNDYTSVRRGMEINSQDIQRGLGAVDNRSHYFLHPAQCQRIALWNDIGDGNPANFGGDWANINDPYLTGYSEDPMMAVFVSATDTYQNTDADKATPGFYFPNGGDQYDDTFPDHLFKPYVKSVTIRIPKGEYSIAEIADLIDGQINGKYVNLQNDDYYTDKITQKENDQEYDGFLDNDGIYSKVRALDRVGIDSIAVAASDSAGHLPSFCVGAGNSDPNVLLLNVLSSNCPDNPNPNNNGISTGLNNYPSQERADMYKGVNPSGVRQVGHPFNDAYGLPYFPDGPTATIQVRQPNGNLTPQLVPKNMLAYNRISGHTVDRSNFPTINQGNGFVKDSPLGKGRKPRLPTEDQLFYIPVHNYNQLLKFWKHYDTGDGAADPNAYENETNNSILKFKTLFRYGQQTRFNFYGASVDAPADGGDNGANSAFIGLHTKVTTAAMPAVVQPNAGGTSNKDCLVQTLPAQLNYNVSYDGYYVGTPDFQFTYDSDMSAYKFSGLHQQLRVPSCDMYGNPMTSEGQTVCYLRRTAGIVEQRFTDQGRADQLFALAKARAAAGNPQPGDDIIINNYSPDFQKKIINALRRNEDRLGGIAVYNWAIDTAKRLGDIDPKTYTKVDSNGNSYKVYNENYTNLWNFRDYFSSEQKAKNAWETTIWARLGFSYDNLQNSKNYEVCSYYDIPTNEFPKPDGTNYFVPRVGMTYDTQDFKIPGLTTRADIGVDAAPTVSTTFNNAVYQYTPNPGTNPPSGTKTLTQIIRTYDNNDVNQPFFGFMTGPPQDVKGDATKGFSETAISTSYFLAANSNSLIGNCVLNQPSPYADSTPSNGDVETAYPHGFEGNFPFDNSNYLLKTRVPILTESKSIVATGLPKLSNFGYYIITSDIVDNYGDDLKQGTPLPLLGVVPISNLSNQDFIQAGTDIIHTTQQTKNVNQITIKILKPDLSAPKLFPNSSVILKITMPLPQNTPVIGNQTEQSKTDKSADEERPQKDPRDDKTKSGGD